MIFSTHQIFIGIYVVLHGKQENNFVSSCESKTHFFSIILGGEGRFSFCHWQITKVRIILNVLFECFLEVLHIDIFYPSIIYSLGNQKYKNSHYMKVRLVFFLVFGVCEWSFFYNDRLRKYEFYGSDFIYLIRLWQITS